MKQAYDICIVGNGVLALSTAYTLSKEDPTVSIALIGSETLKRTSATQAAGAMISCFSEVTEQTLSSPQGRKKFEMGRQALRLWDHWLQDLPKDQRPQITPGTFVILNAKSGKLDCDNYTAILNALQDHDEPFELVDPSQVPGLNPVEDSRPLHAIYLPNEGVLDSYALLETLESYVRSCPNIQYCDAFAEKVTPLEGGAFTVSLDTGETLSAAQVLMAGGAYTQRLLDQLPQIKKRIPHILSGVGYSLTLEQDASQPINHLIRTPNRSGACGLHALPTETGHVYIGASNNVAFSPEVQPTAGLMHFLMECALEQINQNFHASRIQSYRVGNRPAPIDAFPLIGETSHKGLWLLTGTYRDGILQSPLLAEHMAKAMLGKKGLIDDTFAPERSLIQTGTQEESIKEGVKHYFAGAYERGIKLPKVGWDEMLRDLVQGRLKTLYDQLETDIALAPDMLLMFDFSPGREKLIQSFKEYLKK